MDRSGQEHPLHITGPQDSTALTTNHESLTTPMVIGILQVELTIEAAASLKDKRRVVRSLKDRLHREHQVSVAEVGTHDVHRTATLGIVLVSNEVAHCQGVLDGVLNKLRTGRGFVLADQKIELLSGR